MQTHALHELKPCAALRHTADLTLQPAAWALWPHSPMPSASTLVMPEQEEPGPVVNPCLSANSSHGLLRMPRSHHQPGCPIRPRSSQVCATEARSHLDALQVPGVQLVVQAQRAWVDALARQAPVHARRPAAAAADQGVVYVADHLQAPSCQAPAPAMQCRLCCAAGGPASCCSDKNQALAPFGILCWVETPLHEAQSTACLSWTP